MGNNRQNISSESLFHFVNKIEHLIDILENGFKPFYKDEKLPKINVILLISMKCFCDIPLGLIGNHINDYGKYGIGISKDFAIKNGITPVIYTHENSTLFNNYLYFFDQQKYIKKNEKYEYLSGVKQILPYFKLYEEKFKNGVIKYYNEREWRYIPNIKKPYFAYWIGDLNTKDYMEQVMQDEKQKLNNSGLTKLNFTVNDIAYLFLKDNKEIPSFIENLKDMKKNIINEDDINLLISKIITSEQIKKDF